MGTAGKRQSKGLYLDCISGNGLWGPLFPHQSHIRRYPRPGGSMEEMEIAMQVFRKVLVS